MIFFLGGGVEGGGGCITVTSFLDFLDILMIYLIFPHFLFIKSRLNLQTLSKYSSMIIWHSKELLFID